MRADLVFFVPTPAQIDVRDREFQIGIGAVAGRHQAAAGYASPMDRHLEA